MLVRLLLAIVAVETLYVFSGFFAAQLECDEVRLALGDLQRDYDRSQLVLKTLSLSCNTTEHQACLSDLQVARTRNLNSQASLGNRLEGMSHKLERCRADRKRLNLEVDRLLLVPVDQGEVSESSGSASADVIQAGRASSTSSVAVGKATRKALEEEDVLAKVLVRPWLVIGIPTVPRRDEIDYLSDTLRALMSQLPVVRSDPLFERIKVVVMNHAPGQHQAFADNKAWVEASDWAPYFEFVENTDRVLSTPALANEVAREARSRRRQPTGDGDGVGDGASNKRHVKPPDKRVQQQTRDVAVLLGHVEQTHQPIHYMFMEDDFILCENAISATRYLINRASSMHDWIAIRNSFGLNGIIVKGDDLDHLADYLERHQARRPPDHLTTEWLSGEGEEAEANRRGRVNVAFRFNLMHHVGTVSSVRRPVTKDAHLPRCWDPLEAPLFRVERFDSKACPSDDIWPCTSSESSCNTHAHLCDSIRFREADAQGDEQPQQQQQHQTFVPRQFLRLADQGAALTPETSNPRDTSDSAASHSAATRST